MKRKITSKLRLSKETLVDMADPDLKKAAGGFSVEDTMCPRCELVSFSDQGSCESYRLCC